MWISIDPPAKRSLTPNEKRVYELLKKGMEPLAIAKQLHMALQCSCLANYHDVPPDTVMGLIASIRQKGWEIPENKEENNMAKGQKTPVEKIAEITELKAKGKTIKEISEETGTSISTVTRICSKLDLPETEKKPAPSANGTGTKEKSTSTIIPEIPADVNPSDEISDDGFCCEVTGDTDMEAYLAQDRGKPHLFSPEARALIKARISALTAEIEALKKDYAAMGGDI